jgi:predicted amino acid dehydrogenase
MLDYSPLAQTQQKSKVAFIAHPTDISLFRAYIKDLRPDKSYDDRLVMKLFEWSPSYPTKYWDDLFISDQKQVEGLFIMVPFLPEMRDIKLKQVISKIEGALQIAQDNNCTVAALGAFTSIVLQGREAELSVKYNLKLTSGNTLTAALIIEGVSGIASRLGVDLKNSTIAVIGASGDIGSGCLAHFGDKVKKMILTARSTQTLEAVSERLRSSVSCEMIVSSDIQKAIKESNIAIFVTSAYTQLCDIEDFLPGTIVCDASAPQNVRTINGLRDDVFLFHGGIAKLPRRLGIDFDIGLASSDHFYGCQTEGILLALDAELPCSWGRGNISCEMINKYLSLIKDNQVIKVAYSSGDKNYTDSDIEIFSEKWNTYR